MASQWEENTVATALDPALLARVKAEWEETPLWRWYGIKLDRATLGACCFTMPLQPAMVNSDDLTLHGGIIAALIDAAVGVALTTVYRVGKDIRGHTTTELNVSYLDGVMTPSVQVEGRILRKGRTLVVGEAAVRDTEGKLCATGRATYMVFR